MVPKLSKPTMPTSLTTLTTLDALRALYPAPKKRVVLKQLDALDAHCQRFIALSPFVVVASAGDAGRLDASPRGGAPGFVAVADAHTLLIPDAPGNNRLDTLQNIVITGQEAAAVPDSRRGRDAAR